MIGVLLLFGLAVIGAVCFFATGCGRPMPMPGGPVRPEQAHRQAIHHFASGVLPPWR